MQAVAPSFVAARDLVVCLQSERSSHARDRSNVATADSMPETFPYVRVIFTGPDRVELYLANAGLRPLFKVSAWVLDETGAAEKMRMMGERGDRGMHQDKSGGEEFKKQYQFDVLYPDRMFRLLSFEFPEGMDHRSFNARIDSQNGSIQHLLRIYRDEDRLRFKERVQRGSEILKETP